MPKILIIDDDAAQELVAENLRYRGHDVQRFSSASQALDSQDEILKNDLVILDILMDIPENKKEELGLLASGISGVGMHIYGLIRSQNKNIPIIVYSGCTDIDIIRIIKEDAHSVFLSKWRMPSFKELAEIIESTLGLKTTTFNHKVFIVHGHNDSLKLELKNYLQNTLGLEEPIILHERPNMGRTIIDKFEDYAYSSNIAFIILTPDDKVANSGDSDEQKRRARQNVILELGFFLGILGRETGRVILLHVGPLDLPSDLSGVTYIDVSNGIESAGENIRKELDNVSQQPLF